MPTWHDWSRLETQARTQLQRLSPAEKLAMLDGDTPFWGGLGAIAFHDASRLAAADLEGGGGAGGR